MFSRRTKRTIISSPRPTASGNRCDLVIASRYVLNPEFWIPEKKMEFADNLLGKLRQKLTENPGKYSEVKVGSI